MALVLFDHECHRCGLVFEELVERDGPNTANCPTCGFAASRLLTGLRTRLSMGASLDFPTAAAKWERVRKQHQRIEARHHREHGD
jgi:putative FmdB family regulatory protein